MVKQEEKKWYQSKTLWTNVLLIIAGLATWAQGEIATGATITIAGVANAVLRIVSKSEIKF
jgi:hypothetical protein